MTCSGGTLTAVSGSGVITYTGGTVAAGASCTVSVDLTSASPGTYINTSGDLTSSIGNSGDATATLVVEDPSIDVEKSTNGQDADTPTGPVIAVGDNVNWSFTVMNTGTALLTNITVVDDQIGPVPGSPIASLGPGASVQLTFIGTATAGQYANVVEATGSYAINGGGTVSDTDPSHYFGSDPAIDIEKSTNGVDADSPTGPVLTLGQTVNWEYVVTNTGNVQLTGISVTDDQPGVTVDCSGVTTLAPSASMTCTATGTAVVGQYANIGSVTGNPAVGSQVSDTDPSHYIVPSAPGIDIEKFTNGVDADAGPGPSLGIGDPITWTFVVTNAGNEDLTSVSVSDDQLGAISCPQSTLAVSESMMCTTTGTAVIGPHTNVATATGSPPSGPNVTDTDPSHYIVVSAPSIEVEKSTNGVDADVAPGPTLQLGDSVTWAYVVTNTGNETLTNITVTDDQLGVIAGSPIASLTPGASVTLTATGTAVVGQYANVATATGTPPSGLDVTDTDPSHYFVLSEPAINIEKSTNGQDADAAPGPVVPVGTTVTFDYTVTNTGNEPLSAVTVVDDNGTPGNPADDFSPAFVGGDTNGNGILDLTETWTYMASTVVVAGQYANTAVASGTINPTVTDSDASNHFGATAEIEIEKATNGVDADTQSPQNLIPVGTAVAWTYVVTNTGNLTLTNVAVTDDVRGPICVIGTLAPGASTTCSASSVAVEGLYVNVGEVRGDSAIGHRADFDPSHYRGIPPAGGGGTSITATPTPTATPPTQPQAPATETPTAQPAPTQPQEPESPTPTGPPPLPPDMGSGTSSSPLSSSGGVLSIALALMALSGLLGALGAARRRLR